MAATPYDPNRLHVVSFSGGKDSVATWLHLTRELKLPNVVCVFADTGHESEVTYQYLDYLEAQGCALKRVHAKVRDMWKKDPPERVPQSEWDLPLTMERMCTIKGRFPAPSRRFCTTFLKVYPLQKFLSQYENPVSVVGVRAEESEARRDLPEVAYDIDYATDIWRPLIAWTAVDVFECHKRHNIEPNPLYKMGMSRVGCFPCILARKSEIKAIAERFPDRFKELHEVEKRASIANGKSVATFFCRDTVPPSYRSEIDPKSGWAVPTALDVERWGLGLDPAGGKQQDMWEEPADPQSCSSMYGLCE